MSTLINVLKKISNPRHLESVLLKIHKIPIPKLTNDIILLLKQVLEINSKNLQQHNGLILVYKIIYDSINSNYNDLDWNMINDKFNDLIICFFESILAYRKSDLIKEMTFHKLVYNAMEFLLKLINQVDCLRTLVIMKGFTPILSIVLMEELSFINRKTFFLLFKQALTRTDLRQRKTIMDNNDSMFEKLAEFTLVCGDYETQENITEILMRFSSTSKQKLNKIISWYKKYPKIINLVTLLDYKSFENTRREFLNQLNNCNTSEMRVVTLICIEAFANDIRLNKPTTDNYTELWVDFSVSTGSIHLVCDGGRNALLILYVEPNFVKEIFCSNRNNGIQSTKNLLIELAIPLKIQLYSSEVFIATLNLVFLDEPKFYSLEKNFFNKCYPTVYQVEKLRNNKYSLKASSPVRKNGNQSHNRNECFCDGLSSISSIHTTSTCYSKMYEKAGVSCMRPNTQYKLPFSASTPKPQSVRNPWNEDNRSSKAISTLTEKGNELPVRHINIRSDRSSSINHLEDPTKEADYKFRVMSEKELYQVTPRSCEENFKPNTSTKLNNLSEINSNVIINIQEKDNQQVLQTKKQLLQNSLEKEGHEDNQEEEQSQDSPFHLTSTRTVDKVSKINNGSIDNETRPFKGFLTKGNGVEKTMDGKNSANSSNLKILKNLLISEGFNGQGEGLRNSSDFISLSNLSKSWKMNYPRAETHVELKESTKSHPLEKTSNNSTTENSTRGDSVYLFNKSQTNNENLPLNLKEKNGNTNAERGDTMNDSTNTNCTLNEPKIKSCKILRSPKLIAKINKQTFTNSISFQSSCEINNTKTNLFQFKTERACRLDECAKESLLIQKADSNQNIAVKEKENPSIFYADNNTKKENKKLSPDEAKKQQCESIKQNEKNFSQDNLVFKETVSQSAQSRLRGSYEKKRQIKKTGISNKKNSSPNTSLHCMKPLRRYDTKNSAKHTIKQLTPEKVFDEVKNSKPKEAPKQPKTTVRKRKLFNPNCSFDDISSMSEKPDLHSSPSPAKKKAKFTKRTLQNKQKELNKRSIDHEPMIFEDIYRFEDVNNSSLILKKPVTGLRRSSRMSSNVNYIESSSDDSIIYRNQSVNRKHEEYTKLPKCFTKDKGQTTSYGTKSSKKQPISIEKSNEKMKKEDLKKNKSIELLNSSPIRNMDKAIENKCGSEKKNLGINKRISDATLSVSTNSQTSNEAKCSTKCNTAPKQIFEKCSKDDVQNKCIRTKQSNEQLLSVQLPKKIMGRDSKSINQEKELINISDKHNTKENKYGLSTQKVKFGANMTTDAIEPVLTNSQASNESEYNLNTDSSKFNAPKKTFSRRYSHNQGLINNNNKFDSSSTLEHDYYRTSSLTSITKNPVTTYPQSPPKKILSKHESAATEFTSLVEKPVTYDVLREGEQSEMRLEEVPIEVRRSDTSSLELAEPPFRISTEGSDGNPSEPLSQKESGSKLNSTDTQAEARDELDFLDSVISSLERMSLKGGRKKILKDVCSLESSLKRIEMFTETTNKQLNKKCLEVKQNLEEMKSNLENMANSCEGYLTSFEAMMVDIKSTMTRLSKDVEHDQDVKVKIFEDLEKMCKERKRTVRFEMFY